MTPVSSFKNYRFLVYPIILGYLVVLASLTYFDLKIDQYIEDLGDQTNELYSHPFRVNAAAREARLAVSRIRNVLLIAVYNSTQSLPAATQQINELDALLDHSLDTIEANFLGDLAQVSEARKLIEDWRTGRSQLFALLAKGSTAEAEAFMLTITTPLYQAVANKIDYVVDFSSQKAQFFAEQANQKSALYMAQHHVLIVALTIFILLIATVTSWIVLKALRQRDLKLASNQNAIRRFEAIIESTDDAIISKRLDGIIESWNRGAEIIFGYSAAEMIGQSIQILMPADRIDEEQQILARIAQGEKVDHFETVRRRKDGSLVTISATISPIYDDSGQVIAASKIARDFTEHHRAEVELRIAAAAFETQEGIVVTDAENVVLRINQAFSKITGYSQADAIGSKMNLLKSGRHDDSFYAAMWSQIQQTGYWQGEIWNRCKNGEVHPHWMTITSVKDKNGRLLNYVGTYNDITERIKAEEEIRQLAYYDPLTHLPNRRLLYDRVEQAMIASARSQNYCALMFLDLDNFKPLNDLYGHQAGDLLLIEIGNRLKNCVREMDTVARFGGDEFVIMVCELDRDQTRSTEQAERIAKKILIAVSAICRLEVKQQNGIQRIEHQCTASIGINLFIGKQGTQDDVLKQADIAMYQAKEFGRNRIRFYSATA